MSTTTIRATCPTCGAVDLSPLEVTLTICDPADRSSYTFTCPVCLEQIRKPACEHTITLLVSGGVTAHVLVLPAEALEPHPGPELTTDDVLDLRLELSTTDLLAAELLP